jgi:hypothetical protein
MSVFFIKHSTIKGNRNPHQMIAATTINKAGYRGDFFRTTEADCYHKRLMQFKTPQYKEKVKRIVYLEPK